jgi:hypothetical protein
MRPPTSPAGLFSRFCRNSPAGKSGTARKKAARSITRRRQAFFAYSTNFLIDVDNGVIVDVEATTAIRQAEVLAAKRMIERSAQFLHGATLLH